MNPFLILDKPMLRIGVSILAALMLAGCTHNQDGTNSSASTTSQPPIPFTGLTQDLRIVWSAEPGIDLLSGPAVIIRAYRESYIVGGLMASPKFYYPGFEHAVPPNGRKGRDLAIRPYVAGDPDLKESGFQVTTPVVGTWRQHILSLTGDDNAGYTAIVCNWDYGTGVQQSDGQYSYEYHPRPNLTPSISTGTGPLRITLKPPSSNPATAPQHGSAPSPTADVFGGWRILTADHLNTDIWMDEPNDWPREKFYQDNKACIAESPDPYEKRLFYITGKHPKSDYPTLPAEPGWPAAGT